MLSCIVARARVRPRALPVGSCVNKGCASDDCGGRLDHNISIYTSPNLTSSSWRLVSDLLPVAKRPSGTYYRPKARPAPASAPCRAPRPPVQLKLRLQVKLAALTARSPPYLCFAVPPSGPRHGTP